MLAPARVLRPALPALGAALLAALLSGVHAPSASADVGDCKTVYGKGGKASSGYAKVCLRGFSQSSQWAKLAVTVQKRRDAPNNVYVKAGFAFGGFNSGTSRLGPNAPKTYTETIETRVADPEGVLLQLCYDKTLKADPCFSTKTINGTGWLRDRGDTTAPVLSKPVASLASPTSRTAHFSAAATDDSGTVTQMRVRPTGETAWRPWVTYVPSGTVILPDRYGDFTIWFQVRDAAGNLSSTRATDIVTRVRDTTAPSITGASLGHGDPTSRVVQYSLGASDALSSISQMRVLVSGEAWRAWVPYSPSGTIVLPDGYGRFGITLQVMDSAGNASATHFAGAVTRTANVNVDLRQIDNNGNLRSCGATPEQACSDVVKRFRTTIDSAVLPDTNLLLKAWRNINGTWVETTQSPFMLEAINGRRVIDTTVTANLLSGTWRFQAQVPRDPEDVTAFGASAYQYLRIG